MWIIATATIIMYDSFANHESIENATVTSITKDKSLYTYTMKLNNTQVRITSVKLYNISDEIPVLVTRGDLSNSPIGEPYILDNPRGS